MKQRFTRKIRLVATVLALMILPGVKLPRHDALAAGHLQATITHSVSLENRIGVFYNVQFDKNESYSNVRLHIEKQTFKDASAAYSWTSYDLTDYTVQDGCYVFPFDGVKSVEMNSVVKATVYANLGSLTYISDTDEFTVKKYVTEMLTNRQNGATDSDKKLRTLCVDFLNYGAAAQSYFQINTGNLPNSGLTSTQKGFASALPSSFQSRSSSKSLSGATAFVDALALSDGYDACINAYIRFTGNPSANTVLEYTYTSVMGTTKTVRIPKDQFMYDTNSKYYIATISEVASADFKTLLTVVVKNGSSAISGTYTTSMETAFGDVYAVAPDSLKPLLRNAMALSNSSKAYFTSAPSDPTPTKKPTSAPTPTTKVTASPTKPTVSPTKKPTVSPTKKPTVSPTKKATTTPVPTAVHTDGYVTYREMGAKGDGVTDDYDAIVATHEYANKNNLRVKADAGAVYYIGHMDPNNKKGAVIMTDTDWTGATFKIDDKKIPWYYEDVEVKQKDGSIKIEKVVRTDEGDCYLFTVSSRTPMSHVYLNPANGTLGLDARFSSSTDAAAAKNFQNKTFSKNTTLLDGQFQETALYVLRTSSKYRWARNGSATSSAEPRDQMEVVIVDKYDANDAKNHPNKSRIDECTPLQWDWQEIHTIDKWPVDETLLTITGGTFYTNVNNLNSHTYLHRGINIQRSNVLMKGVKHYLEGERGADGQVNESCKYTYAKPTQHPVTFEKVYEVYYPRWGAPYQGFFRLDHCAHVTLSECVFSNHLRVYNYGDQTNSTAPYDYYAEYCADLVIDACTCAADEDDETGPADSTGIMDRSRWGTTGTNFCKKITVQNNSSISRIDAHKGTYDLTVVNSTIGAWGIAAVGFGDLYVANSTIKSREYLVKLRTDFGSAWFGDITINNCRWEIGTYYSASLIFAQYQPTYDYMYDLMYEDGWEYHSMLPENITITGLTIDASKDTGGVFMRDGLPVYSTLLPLVKVPGKETVTPPEYVQVDDDYFKNPKFYKYPLRCTKNFTLSGLTIIKAKGLKYTTIDVIPQRPSKNNHSEYYFEKFSPNMIHYNETPTVVESG